ncbi:MAG: CotH kinase family protein [Muribaculaceae bacterium]|nr:CotH kinase family protein [Muribaculaceae bacterium]
MLLGSLYVIFIGCSDKKRVQEVQENIVISELMASNRTGLLKNNKKPTDWIELKNSSSDSIDLKGFGIEVVYNKVDSVDPSKFNEETLSWKFPEVKIGGGEYLVVFADKGKETKPGKDIIADLKLPKEGGKVRLLTPSGKVINEVEYSELSPDISYALQPDSIYMATRWQSPGFDNNKEGYIKAVEAMDSQRKDPLKIWELMSRAPSSGYNWVELKNTGEEEIELSDYSLAKKPGKNEGVKLPSKKLKPGEMITFQLAGNKGNPYNWQHLPLKLGNSETLILSKDGKFVDGVNAKATIPGSSIGRIKGKKGFFYFSVPTRDRENVDDGKRFVNDTPEFDHKAGVYSKDEKICLRLKDNSKKVRYTVNGSLPTNSSSVFPDSLIISKNTILRTFTEEDSASLRSFTSTDTYLLGVEHNIPVMNITVNNGDLYDHASGIYANGPGYDEEWPHKGANYWKRWTKRAHAEYFDGKEGFSVDCGLRIFGGFSRAEPKKSFRLKFSNEYGHSEVDYDFFGTGEPMALKDLVVRSGSQDYNRCMIRDEFFTSLFKEFSPTLLIQEYMPVALYINAEYFGLYYLREKIDKHFVARKLDIPNDSINIIMSVGYNEEGSGIPYKQLMNYVSNHDMKDPEHYDYVKKSVDLQGLIDYKIGEIYSGNSDVGNIRYVRSTHPESDKIWRFIFYDLDASWVGYKPSAAYYLSVGPEAAEAGVKAHNIMIYRLLANNEFRQLFLERLSHHLSNTISTKNASAVFDKLVQQIRPEMENNCKRWPQLSYKQWEKNVEDFRKKFEDKPQVMLDDIRKHLSITEEENKKYFSHLGY